MDNQTAIEIANAHLVDEGQSIDGLIPNVTNPIQGATEVTFSAESCDVTHDDDGTHRVFLGAFGHFLGLLLSDGSRPAYVDGPAVDRVKGEDPIDAASRYLAAHGVDLTDLTPQLIEPARLVNVWYKIDSDQDFFGGGFEVYITDAGTVVRVYEAQ